MSSEEKWMRRILDINPGANFFFARTGPYEGRPGEMVGRKADPSDNTIELRFQDQQRRWFPFSDVCASTESTIDLSKFKYKLYVYCRRGGVSRDSGLHAELESYSDDGALNEAGQPDIVSLLYQSYDEISFTLVRVEGKEEIQVTRWDWRKPQQSPRY